MHAILRAQGSQSERLRGARACAAFKSSASRATCCCVLATSGDGALPRMGSPHDGVSAWWRAHEIGVFTRANICTVSYTARDSDSVRAEMQF